MEISHYLKVYPVPGNPGELLLFSTRNSSKILIDKKTFHSIQNGESRPPEEAILKKVGILVEDRVAEKRAVSELPEVVDRKRATLDMVVVLNLDCNFSCVYCYEGEMKGKLYMSESTAEHLIEFVKEKFDSDKRFLLIDFYGGEPLISKNLIKFISAPLKDFAESRGATYRFSLVTNGALLKRSVVEELLPFGLESVKITIDGPAEVHNRYRPFKNGTGSFDIIINNIRESCDLVKIAIGGNFEKTTYPKFSKLVEFLEETGLTPEKIPAIKFDPVVKRPSDDSAPPDFGGGCVSVHEPWIQEAITFLREEILKRGYQTPNLMLASCMIESANSYVVNYDGSIYKCPTFIGRKEFEIGDLKTGVREYDDIYKIGIWKNKVCAECEYLPICFGGCRYMSFIKEGDLEHLDCPKAFFDATLETFVKQDIEYARKAD